jgi:hypothetical protein
LFDGNSYEPSIGEQDIEWRFVLVEFVLGNGRMFDQSLNTKLSDQLPETPLSCAGFAGASLQDVSEEVASAP